MIKSIIIDAELNAPFYLKKLLLQYFSKKILVLEVCDSIETGVQAIKRHHPDLVFLDIQMPNEDAFKLYKYFDITNFEIIFTTAVNDYNIDDLRHSHQDYLLKPINYIALLSAIKHFEKQKLLSTIDGRISLILESVMEDCLFNKVALPTQSGYDLIKLSRILYCQAEGNYCKVVCVDGKEFLVSKTLKHVEKLLGNDLFMRVHKSFLVNLNYVEKYDKSDDLSITLVNEVQLPISFRKKERFLNAILKKYNPD